MTTVRYPSITGIYCILIGFLNLTMWTFLILTGKVSEMETRWISMLLHWLAEFTTALLLVITGYRMLTGKPGYRHVYFLANGFLIGAINGAFWYYLVNFSLLIFVLSSFVLLTAIILAVMNFSERRDILWLGSGGIVYGTLNLLGNALERGELSDLAHVGLLLFFVLALVISQAGYREEKMK